MSQLFFWGRKIREEVVELKSRTQSKYSGNKPSELGEITVWIPISFKRTPAAKYLPAAAGGQAKYNRELSLDQPQLGALCILPLSSTPFTVGVAGPPSVFIMEPVDELI